MDYALADSATLTFNGGVSGTEGIIHSGIGPFDIESGSYLSYFTARYQKGARRVAFFTNILTADSTNLLSRGPTGAFLPLAFDTKTFDVEAGDSRAARHQERADVRRQLPPQHVRRLARARRRQPQRGRGLRAGRDLLRQSRALGGRRPRRQVLVDRRRGVLAPHDAAAEAGREEQHPPVVQPGVPRALVHQQPPAGEPSQRSEPESDLADPVAIRLPVAAVGNPIWSRSRSPPTRSATPACCTGVPPSPPRSTGTRPRTRSSSHPVAFYGPANPPPTWPAFIPPFVLGLLPTPLPSQYTYRNLGTVKDKGFELGVEAVVTRDVNVFANYSFQADPVIEGFDPREANAPPTNRFNAGFSVSHGRFLGNMDVNYSGSAYWQDVLDLRYAGTTDAYTLVNGTFGVRWAGEKVVTSLKVTNIGNSEVQQHIFGDVLRRQVVGEVRFAF
jgi:hypothetical protein